MAGMSNNLRSKRPRIGSCEDLVEDADDDIRERVRELEEENRRVKEENKHMKEVEGENKELREAMAELKGMVECPVCFLVPKQGGPVPVCNNGHFVCRTCQDRITQQAVVDGVGEAKCPSCMVTLGSATSLLASRVIEKVKHDCEHEGCEEMTPFADLKKHQLVCFFRKVLCPGNENCGLEILYGEVDEHVRICNAFEKTIHENNVSSLQAFEKNTIRTNLETGLFKTDIIAAGEKLFFARSKRENHSFFVEVTMLGSEAECKGFLASITILDEDKKVFTRKDCRPRPISLEKWGDMGLVVTEKALSSIWMNDGEDFVFDIEVSVEKV